MLRDDGRSHDQIRPITIKYDPFGYGVASVLFEQGNTKVFASVSISDSVPHFLKGRGKGWLTAEYAMLPASTRSRILRESSSSNRNSRSVEISRLIGRSLRAVVDLNILGERTITIDCDILQADGGTRCAAISAASLALRIAQRRWIKSGVLKKGKILKDEIAAISVGILKEKLLLDLSQSEDNSTKADFNFVLTRSGKIVEIQGTSEQEPMPWENFNKMKDLALKGVQDIFYNIESLSLVSSKKQKPMFSLANRINKCTS